MARRRKNPWLAVLNPGRGAPIGSGVLEVAYDRHATHGRGPWVHKFSRGDVTARGRKDGSVVIRSKSGAPVWERDGQAGWFTNKPKAAGGKVKKRRKSAAKRKPPRGFKSWSAYMASIRPNGKRKHARRRRASINRSVPMARKRRRSRKRHHAVARRRHRSNPIARHRRSRRRGARRNPPMLRGILGTLVNAAKGGALGVTGKVVSRAVPALIGVQPVGVLGIATQVGVGTGFGLLARRFMGTSIGDPILYGVFGAAIESLLRGHNIPIVTPALGDETELYALAGYPRPQGNPALNGYPRQNDMAGMGDVAPMMVMG